jgi:aldose 1-epimerase
MSVEIFGQMPDGRVVEKVTIAGGGLAASVLTYGAVLQDLRLGGHDKSLVLGFTELEPYLTSSPYFGAIVGRYANRIRDGHLPLEGKVYQLDRNFLGKHTLHGGTMGTSALLWHLDAVEANAVRLSVRLADGDMGFPGAMDISVSYRLLDDGVMDLVMEAQCDAPSLCNLAHHSYFNLDGGETILDHLLKVDAEQYLPVDDGLIPTGEVAPVDGTRFDFRSERVIGLDGTEPGLDHNLCLKPGEGALRPVACLSSTQSGVAMDVSTTEPGLQVYDGSMLAVQEPGHGGRTMGAYAGMALEPQIWPDSIHHAHFPQAILHPGETYRQRSQFRFCKG